MARIGENEFDDFETKVIQHCVAAYRAIGNPTAANIDDHPLGFHRLKADFDTEKVMAALRRLDGYGWVRRTGNLYGKSCPPGTSYVGYCVQSAMVKAFEEYENPDYVRKVTAWARRHLVTAGAILTYVFVTSVYGLVSIVRDVLP